MGSELLLLLCVVGNVALTVSLKYVAASLPSELSVGALLNLLQHPATWIGGMGLVVAGITFVLAIKTMPVSIAYAVVTGGTILGTVLVESSTHGAQFTLWSITGLALITAGVAMVTR